MNIKAKLSVQFTFIVLGVLLFFSLFAYYFSYSSQLTKFRENLLEKAKNTAILLINVSEVDSTLLKKIHEATILYEKEEIAVTDSTFSLIYGYDLRYLSEKAIRTYSAQSETRYFSFAEKDGVCYKHKYDNKTYSVFVLAFDRSRTESLMELRNVLFWSIIFSLWLSVLFSYFFSQKAIEPISRINKSMKEINSLRLNNRLDEGNRKDEIAQLAITFNKMLTDLEIAFGNQKEFVSNASHELRTPMSVMIGESDYVLNHAQTKEEYAAHLSKLVEDLKKLNTLLNSLLELAQINNDRQISFSLLRIDEVVYAAIFRIKNKYPGRKIVPRISYPDQKSDLLILGNEGLLEMAFANLIDNACKFSSEEVTVGFEINETTVTVSVKDKGIGIPSEEIGSINKPFSRASNVRYIGGFGVGLSIVTRILELHKAEFKITSRENSGTLIEMTFIRKME